MKSQAYRMALLFDFYGDVLTERQKEFYDLYYNEDLSLSEIAENNGITRQGVRDAIKRAEALLFDMESKLKFSKKLEKINSGLAEISKYADEINEYNLANGLSREINDKSVKIKSIALSLAE